MIPSMLPAISMTARRTRAACARSAAWAFHGMPSPETWPISLPSGGHRPAVQGRPRGGRAICAALRAARATSIGKIDAIAKVEESDRRHTSETCAASWSGRPEPVTPPGERIAGAKKKQGLQPCLFRLGFQYRVQLCGFLAFLLFFFSESTARPGLSVVPPDLTVVLSLAARPGLSVVPPDFTVPSSMARPGLSVGPALTGLAANAL